MLSLLSRTLTANYLSFIFHANSGLCSVCYQCLQEYCIVKVQNCKIIFCFFAQFYLLCNHQTLRMCFFCPFIYLKTFYIFFSFIRICSIWSISLEINVRINKPFFSLKCHLVTTDFIHQPTDIKLSSCHLIVIENCILDYHSKQAFFPTSNCF